MTTNSSQIKPRELGLSEEKICVFERHILSARQADKRRHATGGNVL